MKHLPPIANHYLASIGFQPVQMEQLSHYEALIRQWQKAINLIANSTLEQIWTRHLLDSAQLWTLIQQLPGDKRLIDLGSGGGLPGIVLAIAGAEVTMIESDARKGIFLRETARELGLSHVTVITDRVEKIKNIAAPFVTARALAPLKQLVEWSAPFLQPQGTMIFLKGQEWQNEVNTLDTSYKISTYPSITDPKAQIIMLR